MLPAGLLNGEMEALDADDGELKFAVEDYKRPTFLRDARLGARPAAAGRAAHGGG